MYDPRESISYYLFSKDAVAADLKEVIRWPLVVLVNHLIFPRRSWYAAAARGTIINAVGGRLRVAFVYKDVRVSSYRELVLGKDSVIEEGTTIEGPLTLGDLTVIGKRVSIEGPVTLGYGSSIREGCVAISHTTLEDWVGISSNVHFITFTHDIGDVKRRVGKIKFKPILVRSGTWIGTRTTVMPGVTIGVGCVIGAGSLVTRDIPDNSLAVGRPAQVIRKLGPGLGGDLPPEMEKSWQWEKW
jgi:acetyltransferase-like isoleucine patch superfamily enzyme